MGRAIIKVKTNKRHDKAKEVHHGKSRSYKNPYSKKA